MQSSDPCTNALLGILAVQRNVGAVKRDRKNAHLRNSYATLEAVLDAAVPHLTEAGCVVVQAVSVNEGGHVAVETRIMHAESGHWVATVMAAPRQGNKGINELQAAGVTTSYLRRYTLLGLLGLGTSDDTDGEQRRPAPKQEQRKPEPAPEPMGPRALAKLHALTPGMQSMPIQQLSHIINVRDPKTWGETGIARCKLLAQTMTGDAVPHAIVMSDSKPDTRYVLHTAGKGGPLRCTCEGFTHRGKCKHVDAETGKADA